MTEPGAVLEAVHMAIADLAAVLVAARSGLGGDCVRAGSHLEMGEIDLLSARDAVEKARLEIDLAGPAVADVRVTVPLSVGSVVLRSAASESIPVTAGAEVRSRPASGRARRARVPGLRPGRVVLGTRRHVVCLAVGVSRSGQKLVAPCCARTSTDLRRWHVNPCRGRGSGDPEFRYAPGVALRPAVAARRDLPSGGTRSRPLGPCGGGCGSGGAEVSGELVAEFLVLGPQPGDLVAVGPQLLAQ